MKHLIALLLFASPVLAEPVCEKWEARCAIGLWWCSAECTKWLATPTPVATATAQANYPVDSVGQFVISKKSDAEALKALGLKMCEGR